MIKPYLHNSDSKKQQIARMFDNISKRYDLLNHLLSLGIDVLWRKKAIKLLRKFQPAHILDLATGTGDFAFEATALHPVRITACDISSGMLDKANEKKKRKEQFRVIDFMVADAEQLPFPDNSFDALTIAFGIRNFEHLQQGILEMSRVLKNGAPAAIIEFSKPKKFPLKQIYLFYFRRILPFLGKVISKDDSAYRYLPDSVAAFPDGDEMNNILKQNGFKEVTCYPLSGGIASIYFAVK